MEYPGSFFRRPLRLSLLILFIVAFFIISPLIIVISAGYRYDFKNGLFKETGSLSVDILPKTASVYLEGLKIDQTIPVRLNNITPHKYALRLSAPGYYEWEKQIEINKNQTTYVKELILLKKTKAEQISKKFVSNVSISPSGHYLAYLVKNSSQMEVNILDTITQKNSTSLRLPLSENYIFSWAPFAEYLSISSATAPHQTLYVINASNPAKNFNLTAENSANIEKYIWSKDVEPKMYFEANGKLKSYLARLDQTSVVASSTFQDWYLDEGLLWALQFNTSTNELDISSDIIGFKSTFNRLGAYENMTTSSLARLKLESVKKNTVVLSDHANGKYFIVKNDKYFTVNGTRLLYSKFNNWLLAWSPWEIWTYSEGDEPYLLNRSGEELREIIPIDEYNTLALVWKDRVTALHPYFLTQRVIIEEKVNSITANVTDRIIYYGTDAGLWKLQY